MDIRDIFSLCGCILLRFFVLGYLHLNIVKIIINTYLEYKFKTRSLLK